MHAVNLRRLVFIWVAVFWMAFLGIVCTSHAGDTTFGWDTYTDTATGFKLYCARTANVEVSAANLQATITPTSLVQYKKTGMAAGDWYCAMTAYQESPYVESIKSNEIVAAVPLSPPVNFKQIIQALLAAEKKGVKK